MANAGTDYNGDQLCDVWQQRFNAWSLDPGDDTDKDGCPNRVEAIAGTDPFLAADCVRVGNVSLSSGMVVVSVESKKGKRYQFQFSNQPEGASWTSMGAPVIGTGEVLNFSGPASSGGQRRFYQVRIEDTDSDADGVSDWAEEVAGTNPTLAASPNNASGGTASDGDTLSSLMSLSLEVVDDTAFERQDKKAPSPQSQPARLRLVRTRGSMTLTLPLSMAGAALVPTQSNASPADFALPASVVIPAGQGTPSSPHLVSLPPAPDSLDEVPEHATVALSTGVGQLSARVRVCDAKPDLEANHTLFVAYLGREAGVTTTATGLATALVRGDNDSASISVTFSNLTSPQNTAYLRVDNDDLVNIGLGQVTGRNWAIRAGSTKVTDQAMLSALHSGQLYVSITTADHPQGEIRGYFNRVTGSSTFTYQPNVHDAPDPGEPGWSVPAGTALERDIWRLLDQCTYGGTPELYAEVLAEVNAAMGSGGSYLDGYSAWLDKQMNPAITSNPSLLELVIAADNEEFMLRGNKPITAGDDPQFGRDSRPVTVDAFGSVVTVSNTTDGTFNNNHPFHNNRRREMWTLATEARAQVRQRMTQALSEILVISELDTTVQTRHYGAAAYWDMLADHAFGPYRTLLEKVTYSPMMGIYLSHLRNRATYTSGGVSISPDENYAREIMQLFSIGLVLRHPDGSLVLDANGLPIATYDNTDITEMARVMTGFAHGARHANATVQRFNGLNLANNTVRSSPTIEIQGSNFTSFAEGGGDGWFQAPWIFPMKVLGRVGSEVYHDFGAKTLLAGKQGQTLIPAQSLSGRTDAQTHALAEADLTLAHNCLAGAPGASTYNGHQNTPVNLSRWLIQRFTTSNPSAGYLYRVSEVYRQTNGNLGAVLKAILLDYEARSLELADTSVSHGRLKEPLVHFIAVMRGSKARTGSPLSALRDMQIPFGANESMRTAPLPQSEINKYRPNASRFRFPDYTGAIGQSPLRAPSVFNWFLPDFTVPGPLAQAGIVAPEMQITTETAVVNRINRLWSFTWMNLDGMAVFPGVDVDDFPQMTTTAGVQVKVSGASSPASSFGVTRTLTFTPSTWNAAQTVFVAAVDDVAREGAHQTRIDHRVASTDPGFNGTPMPSLTVNITDNEVANAGTLVIAETEGVTAVGEGAASDTYSVALSRAPTGNVVVTPRANAQVVANPASLTFTTANWNTPQTVTVTAVDDASGGEALHYGVIGHTLSSGDANYNTVPGPDVTVYVGDNDSAGTNGVSVVATQGNTQVGEGGATDRFVVALNRAPSDEVTLSFGASARLGLSPSSLVFTSSDWFQPRTVTVTAVDDAIANGIENIALSFTTSGGGYSNTGMHSIVVEDNDGASASLVLTHVGGGNTTVTEGLVPSSGVDSYTVTLSRQPTANVTVTVAPAFTRRPMSDHAKQYGYYSGNTAQSNNQRDRVIFDYSDLITLYADAFAASPGIANGLLATTQQRQAAHFAACTAVMDRLDLMWCGGQLKRQVPVVTLTDLTQSEVRNARKAILVGSYAAYSTSRLNTGSDQLSFFNEARRRVQIIAYLVSISPQSMVLK